MLTAHNEVLGFRACLWLPAHVDCAKQQLMGDSSQVPGVSSLLQAWPSLLAPAGGSLLSLCLTVSNKYMKMKFFFKGKLNEIGEQSDMCY